MANRPARGNGVESIGPTHRHSYSGKETTAFGYLRAEVRGVVPKKKKKKLAESVKSLFIVHFWGEPRELREMEAV